MAMELKQLLQPTKRVLILVVRASYRSAVNHPLISSLLLSLLLLYRYFPSLFAFLLSSSPVIASTTLLLALLLAYGQPNDIERDHEQQLSSLKPTPPADNLVVRPDHISAAYAHLDISEEDEQEEKEASSVEEREFFLEKQQVGTPDTKKDREFFFLEKQQVGRQDMDDVMGSSLRVRIGKPEAAEESRFDSSLGSPWLPVDVCGSVGGGSSESDSNGAESSSPDASMADIIPMLDELHPLLDSEPLVTTREEEVDDESDAGSGEEEAVHREEGDEEEEEEEEGHAEEKVAGSGDEEAVKLTEDDQKNAMDLGVSDIERNRRLESLIAKRRARKDLRFVAERNLIDLDDLSQFHVRPVAVPRVNPFDLPYDPAGTAGMPPVPSSAPSAPLRKQNPFDLTYDQVGYSSFLTTESLSLGEFAFPKRYEEFRSVAPIPAEVNPKKPGSSRLKPFFVAEREEEAGFVAFQRQLSGMSDSKVSNVPDSDTASSGVDHEHHIELLEEELQQENEVLSPGDNHAESSGLENKSSAEVDSVDADHKPRGIIVGEDCVNDSTTPVVVEETHRAGDASTTIKEEIREGEPDSSIFIAPKLEVTESHYDEPMFSTLEADVKSSENITHEGSVYLEPAGVDSLEGSNDVMHSFPAESMVEENIVDSQPADPVYDLSPTSSIKKSLSNISNFDDAVLYAGEGGFNSTSFLASGLQQADTTEVCSKPRINENVDEGVSKSVDDDVDLELVSGEPPLASFDLSSTEKNESKLSESLVDSESNEDSPVDVDESFLSGEGETRDAATHYSDTLVLSDQLISSASEESHPSVENFGTKPSSEAGFSEPQIGNLSNLPSIPEENLEDFKLEEEIGTTTVVAGVIHLTGLQIIEEPDVGLSDIEHKLSFLQRKSAAETGDIDGTMKLVQEAEDIGVSVISPIISSHDTGLSGMCMLETTESVESSDLLDTKCKLEVKSHSASSVSPSDIIDETHDNQGGSFSKELNDESDEVPSEIGDSEEIDEGLLSELDVVGDFPVEQVKSGWRPDIELQSDGQCVGYSAYPLVDPEKQDLPTQLEVSEVGSIKNGRLHSEADCNLIDLSSVANLSNAMESNVASSSGLSELDPEMTVYNPKLHVLEASSFEELDLAFKLLCEETDVSCGSEPVFETDERDITDADNKLTECNSNTHDIEARSIDERDIADADPKLTESDSDLHVIEARSIEDLNSAFEQFNKGGVSNSAFLDVEPHESVVGTMPLGPMVTHSDLQVRAEKTLEDKHLAIEQLTDGTVEDPLKQMEPKHGCAMDVARERNLELGVLEVQSGEEIRMAFEAAVVRESGLSHGQSGEKSHVLETVADDSSSGISATTEKKGESGIPVLKTTQTKDRSGKSGSSSSSSSSSSDSE